LLDKRPSSPAKTSPSVLKDDLDFAVVQARLTYLFNGGSY
jgi:hypothetical protein